MICPEHRSHQSCGNYQRVLYKYQNTLVIGPWFTNIRRLVPSELRQVRRCAGEVGKVGNVIYRQVARICMWPAPPEASRSSYNTQYGNITTTSSIKQRRQAWTSYSSLSTRPIFKLYSRRERVQCPSKDSTTLYYWSTTKTWFYHKESPSYTYWRRESHTMDSING